MGTKLSLKDRLKKKKAELKSKSDNKGKIVYPKPDTTIRFRILPVGEEKEFAAEVIQFYLGQTIKGVYSNATYNEPCPLMKRYDKLKQSKKDDDKDLAKKLSPKQKYLIPAVLFDDDRGAKVSDRSPVLIQVTSGIYQEIIDLYVDGDEWGDMTDPKKGYDLKLSRTGSTMTDTEYSIKPCKNTELPKAFVGKIYDIDKMVKEIIPSYDEAKEKLSQFLHGSDDGDGEGTSNRDRDERKKKIIKKTKKGRDI